ncbi:hypothetical protein O9929_21365 [Vibrio lentus]|nr:hypothetical protein [Vibrio lentus]
MRLLPLEEQPGALIKSMTLSPPTLRRSTHSPLRLPEEAIQLHVIGLSTRLLKLGPSPGSIPDEGYPMKQPHTGHRDV